MNSDESNIEFLSGNEAIVAGALAAQCSFFTGYPLTPATEIVEKMSEVLPSHGGVFVHAESELAVINMLAGASAVGARAMTATSGLGMSLMAEGMSNLASLELPAVVVNVSRGGPGPGSLGPSQGDYFQATKGHGHGDYRTPVLAPWSAQEMAEAPLQAFELAYRYRNPVIILTDAVVAHTTEQVAVPRTRSSGDEQEDWVIKAGRPRLVQGAADMPDVSGGGQGDAFEEFVRKLQAKYRRIASEEARIEISAGDGPPDVVIVAFGSAARVVAEAKRILSSRGISVTLIRPITLWPLARSELQRCFTQSEAPVLVVELNIGQMVEDVASVVQGEWPVHLLDAPAGRLLDSEVVVEAVMDMMNGSRQRLHEFM
jgi:2-oxoglutarate/2-oxoacid ferredoxin oxidoreductase subunit alpha